MRGFDRMNKMDRIRLLRIPPEAGKVPPQGFFTTLS